jgi:GT2 family glycosyltransferase
MLDDVQTEFGSHDEHRRPTSVSHDEAPIAVSIVVLNHNGRDWLERCLGATVAELAPDCELIVVDNGSDDGSDDFVARTFPTIRRVALEHNLGFAEGNNVGAKAARGRCRVSQQ